MAETVQHGVDSEQVKKAVKALLAYHKTKENGNLLLLNDHERISILVTVWKIPKQEQTIKIPLPHGIQKDTSDICLFTRDEPNMSSEQTEKFYKKLLSQHGVTQISEIIPLQKMKKEYKPYEAKRRLLSSFNLFLADDRIRRLLTSQIGKHFYKAKREPLSVNLKSKNLAVTLNKHIQGTRIHVHNKGCCYSVCVGHIGMKVKNIVENTLTVAQVLAERLPMKWKNVKVLHMKTQTSVALPIYNSSFYSLKELNLVKPEKKETKKKKKKKFAKKGKPATTASEKTKDEIEDKKKDLSTPHKKQNKPDDVEEEIPQLIPIQEPCSVKKSKKKKKDVKEESKVKGNDKVSEEEEVQVSSAKKPTLKKRKMNESEEVIKTPSKHKKAVLSEEESKEPEELETPPKHSILKKTPSNSAVKLTKSARKAPQTPKMKLKMKTPKSA